MTMKIYSITMTAAIASLVALAPQAVAKTATSVSVAQEARETFKQLKSAATSASAEAERLEMLGLNPEISPESHVVPLMDLRRDVNTMGKRIASLEAQRDSLEPWEKEAVDKVLPLLKDAADNTQNAIEYFNGNRAHLWTAEHLNYTANVERDSDGIAKTLKTYLQYKDVREAELQLESTVGAGSN